MSRIFTTGFEIAVNDSDDVTSPDGIPLPGTGVSSRDTTTKRTGAASGRCDCDISGESAGFNSPISFTSAANRAFYTRVYFNFSNFPDSTVSILAYSSSGTNRVSVRIDASGQLQLWDHGAAAQIGSLSSSSISSNTWYRIELCVTNNASSLLATAELRLNGVQVAIGSIATPIAGNVVRYGWLNAPTSGVGLKTLYMDDVAGNDSQGSVNNSWPDDGKVVLMKPISDAQVGSWTGGAGGTTNLYDAVNNTPPIGTASETNLTQIESVDTSGNNTTDEYRADCGTYLSAGVGAGDVINAVHTLCNHGEDSTTGTKAGTMGAQANPVQTYGSFDYGAHVGALSIWPVNWRWLFNTVIEAPTVTIGSSLILGLRKTDANAQAASCDFIGAYVDYSPPAATTPKSGTDSGSGSDSSVITYQISGSDTSVGKETEPVFDNFNRADDTTPPPGPIWSNWKGQPFHLLSNQLAPATNGADAYCTIPMPPNVQAWIEIPTMPSGAESWLGILARLEPNAVSGYIVQYYMDWQGIPANDFINIYRYDDWVATLIGGSYPVHLEPGDAFAIRCAGNQIRALVRTSGYSQVVGVVTDTTYDGSGLNNKVALIHIGGEGAGSTVCRLDNFGANGIPATAVAQNSDSDTGTGIESSVLVAVNSVSDAGTGSDDSVIDKHVIPVSGSDTGASADASVLAVAFSISDAGFLTLEDASVVIAPIKVGDDTGAGNEVISQFTRFLPDFGGDVEASAISTYVSDSGAGSEGITDLSRSLQDSGTGTENYVISKFADDAGVGSDNRINTASLTAGDSSTGYEIVVPASARYTQSETGIGIDASLLPVAITGSESMTAIEAPVIKAVVSGADTGGLAAETGVLALTITVTDIGTGSEVIALAVKLTTPDTGTAVEITLFSLLMFDSVIGSDITALGRVLNDFGGITEFYAISVAAPSDNGTSAEVISGFTRAFADLAFSVEDASISVGNERIGSESGSFVETALLVFKTIVVDSGIGIEISGSNTPVFGSDFGTFVEIFAIRTTLSDLVSGIDISNLGRALFDTGIGAEGQSITAGNTRQDSDSGHAIENYILDKVLPLPESGTSSESGSLAASHIRLDSGSVSENTVSGVAPIRIDDNGAGIDQGQLRQWKSGSDSGTFTEKGHAGLFVITKFHTSKLVTANGQDSKLVAANHPYYVRV